MAVLSTVPSTELVLSKPLPNSKSGSEPGSAQAGAAQVDTGRGSSGRRAQPEGRRLHTSKGPGSLQRACCAHTEGPLPPTKQHCLSSRAVAHSWGSDGLYAIPGVLEQGDSPRRTAGNSWAGPALETPGGRLTACRHAQHPGAEPLPARKRKYLPKATGLGRG